MSKPRFDVTTPFIVLSNLFSKAKVFLIILWNRLVEVSPWRMAANYSFLSLLLIIPFCVFLFTCIQSFTVFGNKEFFFSEMLLRHLSKSSIIILTGYYNQFIDNIILSSFSAAILLTIFLMLLFRSIESDFNLIFRSEYPRRFISRLLIFWAIFTLGPVFIFISISMSNLFIDLINVPIFDFTNKSLSILNQLGSVFSIILIISLMYLIIPNRRIKFWYAITGGGGAAINIYIIVFFFFFIIEFLCISQSISGILLCLPVVLLFGYLLWIAVLFGALISGCLEDWSIGTGKFDSIDLDSTPVLIISLQLLGLFFSASQSGSAISLRVINKALKNDTRLVTVALRVLSNGNFIKESDAESWVLSRDLSSATLNDLCQSIGINIETFQLFGHGTSNSLELWRSRLVSKLDKLSVNSKIDNKVIIKDVLID